jgi:polyhydroxybutyrate depolymerase
MSSIRRPFTVLVAVAAGAGLLLTGASSAGAGGAGPSGGGVPTLAASTGTSGFVPGRQVVSLDVNGSVRTALLSVPEDLSRPAPLIFAFHGHGGTGPALDRKMDFEGLWTQAIVVYPNGLTGHSTRTDPRGLKTGWQTRLGQDGNRDIAFYDSLLEDLEAKLPVDRSRIYLMGHSNGSDFVSLLLYARGQTIAATANSSGQPTAYISSDPVRSEFMSMGIFDQTVPYARQQKAIPLEAAHLGVNPATRVVTGYLTTETGPGGVELDVYAYPGGHRPPPQLGGLLVAYFQRHTLLRT